MKKLLLVVAVLGLVGCSTSELRNGRNSVNLANIAIEPEPMTASIKVGQKISGTAECETLFGFTLSSPKKLTYGADLQVEDGNFAPSKCTRGAIYDALTKNKADVIIAPQYTATEDGTFCIFGHCAYRSNKITVTGYKGTIEKIATMDKAVVAERQKHGVLTKADAAAPVAKKGIMGMLGL